MTTKRAVIFLLFFAWTSTASADFWQKCYDVLLALRGQTAWDRGDWFSPTFKRREDGTAWLEQTFRRLHFDEIDQAVLYYWRVNVSVSVNRYLRKTGPDPVEIRLEKDLSFPTGEYLRKMDEVTTKKKTDRRIVAYRGINEGEAYVGLRAGEIFTDPGYSNLTLDPEVAAAHAKKKRLPSPVVLEVLVDSGEYCTGITLPPSSSYARYSSRDSGEEMALVFPRNRRYEVVSSERRAGITYLRVKLLHDEPPAT